MTKPLRRRLPCALALISAAAAGAIWGTLPKDGLLDRATLLVPKDKWVGPERRNGDIGNYAWLTNDEVLLYRQNGNKMVTLFRKRVLPQGHAEAAASMALDPLPRPETINISPDRETLHVRYLNPSVPRRNGMTSKFVSLRDGHTIGTMRGYVLGEWCDGSASICDCRFENQFIATVHHYDTRTDEKVVVHGLTGAPLSHQYVWPLFIEATGRAVALGDSHYDGIVTPTDKARLGSKLSNVRTFVEFDLKHPGKKGRIWTVPVPADAATFLCLVSPGHDRLLWIVQSNRMPFLPTITQKLPRPFKQQPRYLCRWMVSDLEGRGMHTIAEFEISDLYFNRPDLLSPQWNPDGKHISFEHKGALYMIPVN